MFSEVSIDRLLNTFRKQYDLRDALSQSISNCILGFINNKWLQPSAQALMSSPTVKYKWTHLSNSAASQK